MVRVYDYDSYRCLLRALAEERKTQSDGAFKFSHLAEAMGIQPTYLSRAFKEEAHLSTDQIELAIGVFELNENESIFLHTLAELEKTGLQARRKKLTLQLKELKEQMQDTKNHLKAKTLNRAEQILAQEYYLEPYAPLVQVCLSIPEFSKHPEKICNYLGLSEKRLREILALLVRFGFVRYETSTKTFTLIKDHLHLEKESPLHTAYQRLTRTLSQDHVAHLDTDQKHQYTVTFGCDEKTFDQIHNLFNQFISQVEKVVRNSPVTGVYQLNFDLFQWGKTPKISTYYNLEKRPKNMDLEAQ